MRKILLGAILASVVVSPAFAGHTEGSATEFVTYGDLNLDATSGRLRLEHRLHAAANRLCADDTRAVPTAYVDSRCYRTAMERAHEQMSQVTTRIAMNGSPSIIVLRR